MHTHLNPEEALLVANLEEIAATGEHLGETADAGERLEAGLEADQAERARLEAKWSDHMRRFDAAQNLFDRGMQNWFKKLVLAFGVSLLFWGITFPLGEANDFLAIARYVGPLLIGAFVFMWLGINVLGNWALNLIFPMIRKAAEAEGVEVHGPSVKRRPS